MNKKVILLFVLIFAVIAADAQTRKKKGREEPVEVEEVQPEIELEEPELSLDPLQDTTTSPSMYPVEEEPPVDTPTVKPYERIVLYIDSNTNLITYTGVQEEPESSSDSLYYRAKKWATKKFVGGGKALFEIDKKSQKLVINGIIPAYVYGKYSKREIGKFEFKMTVLFREERYKYTITNLVHESSKGNIGGSTRNYFEFYNTTTTNIKSVDNILRNADKDINELVEDFKKTMKTPKFIDEDDW